MVPSEYEHEPVLLETVLEQLALEAGDWVLDATVGLGGHAAALVPRILPGGRYIGLDWDGSILAEARVRLATFGDAVVLEQANYAEFTEVLVRSGRQRVEAMLLDLGVNSAQLADPVRGFSFDREGPLDMRFNPDEGQAAMELVNRLNERELADLFYEYAQEPASRKIAKRICQVRHNARITTTGALARAVVSALGPAAAASGKLHPATRVFQALRIAVNRELDNLVRFLERAADHLSPGGRLAVISFHSLEDGIVKRFLRQAKKERVLQEVTKRPLIAEGRERGRNPRSRSAKLRVAIRLDESSIRED